MTATHPGSVAAVDLGATSGRVMLGRVGPGELVVEAVHRFPNEPVHTPDGLYWDIGELYRQVLIGLRRAVARAPDLLSIGIDSWAVDYGLVRDGDLVGRPHHYRDERTGRGAAAVHAVVSPPDLYAASGLQFMPFNTLYQLTADRLDGQLDDAATMLLIPDLIGSWLTGVEVAERTNASTTGLLDRATGGWNHALIDRLRLPGTLFPPLVEPGTVIGNLSADVLAQIGADRLGAGRPIPVVAVGSHDTASAVVAVPMAGREAAYISSGTWSLVGVELDEAVLTDPSFTNEGGVDGRVRYLRNVMGMWLLNECVRTWEAEGAAVDLGQLLADASALPGPVAVFDVLHPSLLPPGDMPARITELCGAAGPTTPAEFARSICESLATAYATAIADAERLTGVAIRVVHVVGGGSQNALLAQLTADRSSRRVLTGPVEATAIGNVLVQARAAGLVSGSLEDLRALVARTHPSMVFEPR